MEFKVSKSIENVPLKEVDLYCEITGSELSLEDNEIIILEVKTNE